MLISYREYNLRKNRKGSFWGDRYLATAVKAGKHLIRCLAYIDLNGDKEFVMQTKAKPGAKAMGRNALGNEEDYVLKESQNPYKRVFTPGKCTLRLENDYFWQAS